MEATTDPTTIEYFHASEYGNGAAVAEEFRRLMATRGVTVHVQHIHGAQPTELPPADLYVFSSPGRRGKPIKTMRRFLKKISLPPESRCAVLTTELAPQPNRKTGLVPSEAEQARWQRVRPVMSQTLTEKGLVVAAVDTVLVTDVKGPLEEEWRSKVEAFAVRLTSNSATT